MSDQIITPPKPEIPTQKRSYNFDPRFAPLGWADSTDHVDREEQGPHAPIVHQDSL